MSESDDTRQPIRLHRFVLDGGPWNGYTFGGCPGSQCEDEHCDRLPAVLSWDGLAGGRYVRESGVSISSDGPFEVWSGSYRWEPGEGPAT